MTAGSDWDQGVGPSELLARPAARYRQGLDRRLSENTKGGQVGRLVRGRTSEDRGCIVKLGDEGCGRLLYVMGQKWLGK